MRSRTAGANRRIARACVASVSVTFALLAVVPAASWGDHIWEIKNEKWPGMCLDARYGQDFNGAEVWLWRCNGSASQRWLWEDFGDIGVQIQSSYDGRCLDVNLSNPRHLQRWTCIWPYGRPENQVWHPQATGLGSRKLYNRWSRRVVDAHAWAAPPGNLAPNGTLVQTWQRLDIYAWPNQNWFIVPHH